MIIPEFNEKNIGTAYERARNPLSEEKFDFDIVAFSNSDGKSVKYFNSDHGEHASITGKSILLASISKALTGTAVARMVDKKLIHWDEPLCRYLNGLKDGTDNEKIKIGHVFLHRTGYTDIEQVDPEKVPPCEAYRELIKKPPLFKPGAFFKYSSMTYWFINALVREVLGFESMDDFLKEWLFAPCGMENTTFHPVPGMAVEPHYLDAEGMEKYMGLQIPGSGLWSCPDDLLSFGDAVLTPGKLFSEETFREMTEGYPMEKFDGGGFSCRTLGWVKEINFNNQPQRGFFHGGATGGVLWLDPEARAVILFMAGKWGTGNDDAFNVIKSFYGE